MAIFMVLYFFIGQNMGTCIQTDQLPLLPWREKKVKGVIEF
jgi:hypothetical protein